MPSLVGDVISPGAWSRRPQPVIDSPSGLLRPWSLDDVPVLVEAYTDLAIQQWHGRSMTSAEATDWITTKSECWNRESAADWAVEVGERIVGRVGFRWVTLGEGCAEIAYWTLPRARGNGYASEAVRTLSRWAVDAGLHRVELRHAVANTASCVVAESCGYRAEGTAVSATLHADGWHDMHTHGLIAP